MGKRGPIKGTVLLVDDEPHLVAGLKIALRQEPLEILTATSALEGLEVLSRTMVDLVISDEEMPGMTGTAFLAEVRKKYPEIVRVILTGRPSLKAALRSINEGHVFRFLLKPCQPTELIAMIQDALRMKAASTGRARLMQVAQEQIDLLHSMVQGGETPPPPETTPAPRGLNAGVLSLLSSREQEIVHSMAQGHRVKKIATTFFLSEHTVRNHLKSIFFKLDVHSQTELLDKLHS